MLGIWDEVAAFCLDDACALFGNFIENKLNETDKNGRPKHRLSVLLVDVDAPPVPIDVVFERLNSMGPGLVSVKEIKL
jgi:hypothetical protein